LFVITLPLSLFPSVHINKNKAFTKNKRLLQKTVKKQMSHNLYVRIRPTTDGRRLCQKRLLQPAILDYRQISWDCQEFFPFFFSKIMAGLKNNRSARHNYAVTTHRADIILRFSKIYGICHYLAPET
jgi:hypothetical protein